MSSDRQDLEAKRGEVRFRRLLSEQQLGSKTCLPESFSSEEIISIIEDTIAETRGVFRTIVDRQIPISPFLEIGAERGERSFVIQNEFDAHGFAFDLSLDALQFGNRLISEFGFKDMPLRVCGDAYTLPFRSDIFPFVCCFATLHHVPDPLPVVREATRVLQDGGHFYFDREPTRGRLTVSLWTRYGHKLSPIEMLLSRLGILGFISEGGGMEREFGVLENTFRLSKWLEIMKLFDAVEMAVNKTLKIRFDPHHLSLSRLLANMLGGVTSGLCRVKKSSAPLIVKDWVEMLRCPTCSTVETDYGLTYSSSDHSLSCQHCGTVYPELNGVLLLLPKSLQQELYADWMPV